ncbi:MAG: hypothetical protein ACK5W1_05795 [Flavobacteriales bacterium]|jgi:hypothetical protein
MQSGSNTSARTNPGPLAIVGLVICLKVYLAILPLGFGFLNLRHLPVPYWRIEHDEDQ